MIITVFLYSSEEWAMMNMNESRLHADDTYFLRFVKGCTTRDQKKTLDKH
jgi:hypothetical protein